MSFSEEVILLYKNLCDYKAQINSVATKINSGETVFGNVSIELTNSCITELNFQRVVSWLYILYWEEGKKADIEFLVDRFSGYSLDVDGKLFKHFKLVSYLRTYFQHNIVTENKRNKKVKRNCIEWFKEQCVDSLPIDEQTWNTCLMKLIQDAEIFFKALLTCIQAIEDDESRDEIIYQWRIRRKRRFFDWEFDDLINEIIGDLGVSIDVNNFRRKYRNEWSNFLKTCPNDSDFKAEARKLILGSILKEQLTSPPLLPTDIVDNLGVQAGSQKMYELFLKAQIFYINDPALSTNDLIKKLQAEI